MGIKLIHTADLHLSNKKPETINALDEILTIARKEEVDIVTISGDLFDSALDADNLRPRLREKFSNNDFDIIVIPGNHDSDVYQQDYSFGSNFIPMVEKPFQIKTKGNLNLVALPYVERLTKDLLTEIQKQSKKNKTNILLIHCTLDIGFCKNDFGEETKTKYCPISKSELSRLNYDFILAGHFHKKSEIIELNENSQFIYPGSPVSLTSKELEKRNVVFIDTINNDFSLIPLNTFYFDKLHKSVYPGKEDLIANEVTKWVIERSKENCTLEVIIDGFIQISEKSFETKLSKIKKFAKINHDYKDIQIVLKNPLFHRFKEKLMEKNLPNSHELELVAIDALSQLISSGEIK